MDNNNPAEMSNSDLEKDMQRKYEEKDTFKNNEDATGSNISEGTLKTPDEESSKIAKSTAYKPNEEQDLDDLVHARAKESHNGSLPDPEEVKMRGE